MVENYEAVLINENLTEFRVVKIKSVIVLFLFTFCLYRYYWFYKNWKKYNEKSEEKVIPLARTIFMFYFIMDFVDIINEKVQKEAPEYKFHARIIGGILMITMLAVGLFARIADKHMPIYNYLAVMAAFEMILLIGIIQIQKAINISN